MRVASRSFDMDYAKPADIVPADIVAAMINASTTKLARDLLIRGAMSGALLGVATSPALGAAPPTALYATYKPARHGTFGSPVTTPVSPVSTN